MGSTFLGALERERADVLVVGAGPAGLITAREASSRGLRVVVVEEHREVGLPVHCSGLVSAVGLQEIGVKPNERLVQNEVKGARFYSPSGLTFSVAGRKAYVVDRAVLDKTLAAQTSEASADLILGFKARNLIIEKGFVSGVADGSGLSLMAKMVINAEGFTCELLKKAGMKTPNLKKLVPALQVEVTNVAVDPDYVEIFVGRKIAPGFFSWIIPTGPNSAKVGTASVGINQRSVIQKMIKERFNECKIVDEHAGCVITGGPSSKTYGNGILVVGDAAGHVKATTGGGVVTGGVCAKIAGKVAVEAVSNNDTSSSFLRSYEERWRRLLGRELSVMRLARTVSDRLSDATIDALFDTVLREGLSEDIEEYGDVDFQSRIFRRLAMRPSILRVALGALGDLLLS